ncbi:hypothetical protein PHYSODRAFT_294496 [Phytophthora sojae]|uniref:BZIP domain-containing protein n=1 Tax=Phytophthora sojae (strain P6497) TaxID=1094619 RepID=G4YMR7_PHYSP|nr:hypothetical protein PHYSODRAFT_294496 [Phytophthora sojae]EGZ29264.1 hypothetical protein PHYSODRAFT_294496 [Phytophthora sojae]|eukprot:XP_009516539.1 hypothetical protein PHYSODRAFT_294496 [Phytophthora sojae]
MSQNASSAANQAGGKGSGKARARAPAPARAGARKDEEVDEKVLRRRQQYKMHQRRHRAKQKAKAASLELEVLSLAAEVEALARKRQKLLVDNNFFASRGTAGGVPARVAMEYFRLFQFGASPLHIDQQEQFLRAVMTAETEGPDYVGVDTVVTQWRHYCSFFDYTRYEPQAINVTTVGELTVVEADSIFSICARRDGVVTLYPSLNGDLELTQKLSGSIINIHGKYRFTFDAHGMITWFSAEWDLVDALQRALGSLADVSTVLSDANISASTGQITVDQQQPKPRVDPRHNVEFLLS